MSPEDVKKLLGGYATGTLTPEEQQALFAAALEDQELFDELAREQSLRDLLRDPAARGELLAALDTPPARLGGFWQWLRRPMVAGLATAAVLVISVVAVWQSTRVAGVKPAVPVIVAELRPQEQPAPKPLTSQPEVPARRKVVEPPASTDKKAVALPVLADAPAPSVAKDVAPTMALPAPPPPAAPAAVARKGEGGTAIATLGVVQAEAQAVTIDANDARTLFYANQPAPAANALVPGGARADAAPRKERALSGFAAAVPLAAAPRLGVRVSILRGAVEADLTTVLDPGETVRLKLIPNADGFLYVAEGARIVATGTAHRLQPFETPELTFTGSGQKQLRILFSRSPQVAPAQSLESRARDNVMETPALQERATYVVAESRAQQIVVPVTLTYR
jgi:hypothetical protein